MIGQQLYLLCVLSDFQSLKGKDMIWKTTHAARTKMMHRRAPRHKPHGRILCAR